MTHIIVNSRCTSMLHIVDDYRCTFVSIHHSANSYMCADVIMMCIYMGLITQVHSVCIYRYLT